MGIMLHNYCHWLGRAVKENEFTFTRGKAVDFFRRLGEADWYGLPIDVASFLGHYGVPIFLFLSAYGLVMKYERAESDPSAELPAGVFLKNHFQKLFLMMIFGYAMFLVADLITPAPHSYAATDVAAQLLMVNNLLPHPDKIIWPGPYWFFGLMMQLYLVYRLVLYRRSSWLAVVVVALCTAAQLMCQPEGETLNRLRYNCVGAMLPFCGGLLYARAVRGGQGDCLPRHMPAPAARCWLIAIAAMALLFILAGSMDFCLWLFVPLAVCALWVAMVKLLPDRLTTALAWVGNISAAIFVLHPLLRKIFIPISRRGDVYAGLLIYIMCTIVAAYAYTEWRKLRV